MVQRIDWEAHQKFLDEQSRKEDEMMRTALSLEEAIEAVRSRLSDMDPDNDSAQGIVKNEYGKYQLVRFELNRQIGLWEYY